MNHLKTAIRWRSLITIRWSRHSTVPAKHGFWADDEEVPPRGWPEAIDPDPQDSITLAESRSRIGTEGNPELVTQDKIFQKEIPSRSKAEEETADHQ
jgi:hypothetical protein